MEYIWTQPVVSFSGLWLTTAFTSPIEFDKIGWKFIIVWPPNFPRSGWNGRYKPSFSLISTIESVLLVFSCSWYAVVTFLMLVTVGAGVLAKLIFYHWEVVSLLIIFILIWLISNFRTCLALIELLTGTLRYSWITFPVKLKIKNYIFFLQTS